MNILFTCAGRRNYLINYFKSALKGKGLVLAADNQLSAPALVDADVAFEVPGIYESNYIKALKDIINKHSVDAIISLNDLELPILSKKKEELEAEGTKVIISSKEIVDIAFDKWKTYQFIEKIGLKSPKTYLTLEDTLHALENGEITFPLVVKPRWGSASIGIEFPESIKELKLIHELLLIKLNKSILKNASTAEMDKALIFQEKIDAVEYGIDILNNLDGEYYGTFARKKISMRSGETDKAMSIIDNNIERIGHIIGKNSKHIGNMDCDIFLKNDNIYVLELNPRFGGGYPFSHEAGIDTASIFISWLKGDNNISKYNNYKHGHMYAKCDKLISIPQVILSK